MIKENDLWISDRPARRRVCLAAGLISASLLLPAAPAAAQTPAPQAEAAGAAAPPAAPAASAAPRRRFQIFGSWRVRQEAVDWFDGGPEGRYTFTGSLLRVGASYSTPRHELTLELAQPALLNLPLDASLAPPLGQAGLGAAYRDANGSQQASLFVKQAYWTAKGIGGHGGSISLGRFEFSDGAETAPKDPALAWLKRERIAQRLIGNFGFTHVQRSFDGGRFSRSSPKLNLTLMAGMPTEGSFDLDGGATLERIKLGYAAITRPFTGPRFQGEARLFGAHYLDGRSDLVKTDNRPLAVRLLDTEDAAISTIGGHLLGVWNQGGSRLDGLVWGAFQFGDFGQLSHRASSFAVEAGWQPEKARWNPWLRAGFFQATGDGDPADGDHGTFFPMLPTARIYARFPFYTATNLNDAFAQVVLRPNRKWTLRSDLHALWLAEKADLWYVGGGAFQNTPSFGFGGRPSGGESGLATLLDLSVDYQWRKQTTISAYAAYAIGGGVINSIYGSGSRGAYGYLELTQRF